MIPCTIENGEYKIKLLCDGFKYLQQEMDLKLNDINISYNQNDSILIPYGCSKIMSFENIVFGMKYNADELDVVSEHDVSNDNISIVESKNGSISFKRARSDKTPWTGVVNTIRLKAKVSGSDSLSSYIVVYK